MTIQEIVQTISDIGTIGILLFLLMQTNAERKQERQDWQTRLDSKERAHIDDLKDCAGLTPHIVRPDTRRIAPLPTEEANRYKGWLNGGES